MFWLTIPKTESNWLKATKQSVAGIKWTQIVACVKVSSFWIILGTYLYSSGREIKFLHEFVGFSRRG
jgi:hypothetical protein